jgi:acetate---CoA ligase (ADP-forming)
LQALFAFKGLAVVGATPRNPYAKSILDGLASVGFTGEVACVNPNAEAVGSTPGYASLAGVPFPIDAVAIVVRADRVPEILEECGRLGVRSATVVSAGFAESGQPGRALQERIAEIARRFDIALCGPNSLGFASFHDRTSTYSRSKLPAKAGGVAVVSHSGGMLNEVLSYGSYRGLRFSKVVSSGNEAVLGLADYLDDAIDDRATTTIGLIVEGVRAPERVRAAFARAASVRKPVVAIKIGSSALACASAVTHTGAMAGSADLFAALCERYGVTLVEDIDELCESLLVFSRARALLEKSSEPRGLAAIEISGGGKGLICDLADRRGLALPQPRDPAMSNPLDLVLSWETPQSLELHAAALEALAADGAYDLVVSRVSVLPSGPIEAALEHGRLIERMQRAHPEMLFTVLGRASDSINPVWLKFCDASGLTYLQSYKRGIAALANLDRYRRRALRPLDDAPPLLARRPPLPRANGVLDEAETKDVLASLGFPVNPTRFAATEDDAAAAAEALGYPVVVKGLSPQAVHKSDGGFVALDLREEQSVRAVSAGMLARLHALGRPDGARVGVSVQNLVATGLEVIVGAHRDPVYGAVVLCALGGVFAEAFDDRLLWLAPVGPAEALEGIRRSKIGQLAAGFRSLPPADLAPLAALVAGLSGWIAADERIRELDLNPVILRGSELTIVDARAVAG